MTFINPRGIFNMPLKRIHTHHFGHVVIPGLACNYFVKCVTIKYFFLIQFYVPFKIISAYMRRADQ